MGKIVYKLLDNDTGVILTRNPKTVTEKISVRFEGAKKNAVAAFTFADGTELYRELKDGECSIRLPNNEGEMKVAVTVLDGTAKPRTWVCEQIKYKKCACGEMLVSPNDMNLPQTVTELKLENEELRLSFAELEKKFKSLEERFNNMMEGYDLM